MQRYHLLATWNACMCVECMHVCAYVDMRRVVCSRGSLPAATCFTNAWHVTWACVCLVRMHVCACAPPSETSRQGEGTHMHAHSTYA